MVNRERAEHLARNLDPGMTDCIDLLWQASVVADLHEEPLERGISWVSTVWNTYGEHIHGRDAVPSVLIALKELLSLKRNQREGEEARRKQRRREVLAEMIGFIRSAPSAFQSGVFQSSVHLEKRNDWIALLTELIHEEAARGQIP